MTKTNVAMRLGLLAAALTGAVGISAGYASAASAHPAISAASAAGTYNYNDSVGDKGEGLTLNANGTAVFESGCKGIWVTSGSSIALDINSGCNGTTWIFSGTVNSAGLNSATHKGHLVTFGPSRRTGTWFATRV